MIYLETPDYLVINKPAGTAVQSANPNHESVEKFLQSNNYKNIKLINRIDQPVSGFCLIAKTTKGYEHLYTAQKNKEIKKKYLAVVEGHFVPPKDRRVELYIKKNEKLSKSFIVETPTEGYKRCFLKFKNYFLLDNYTIIDLDLKTGRYHQIRAMLSHLGHPIKGDVKYGARRKNKDRSIFLHSWKLNFTEPESGEKIQLIAPLNLDNPLWKIVDKVVKLWE
jgi:23S rRNA pseudouridine1911/1915/1917 synthase